MKRSSDMLYSPAPADWGLKAPLVSDVELEDGGHDEEEWMMSPPVRKKQKRRGPVGTTYREYATFPDLLSEAKAVGALDIRMCRNFQQTCERAEQKLAAVMNGTQGFGYPVVIPSFQARYPAYKLTATLPNLVFMHALFRSDVCDTHQGTVSVFPCTVHTSRTDYETRQNGFPVLAIHRGHFRQLLWRMFSRTRYLIDKRTLGRHLKSVLCSYDENEDGPLITFSGFEPYSNKTDKKYGTFMLLPAHWVDVMKHFFVIAEQQGPTEGHIQPPTYELRSFYEVCRRTYARPPVEGRYQSELDRQLDTFAQKFVEEYSVMVLGDERRADVSLIKNARAKNVHSMARCRAFNNRIRFGRGGPVYKLLPNSSRPVYNEYSLGYGVECWDLTLSFFNSMYSFFTDYLLPCDHHMEGLLHVNRFPVRTREQCRKSGIRKSLDEIQNRRGNVSPQTRRRKYLLKNKYGANILTDFWGKDNVARTYRRLPSHPPPAARNFMAQ